jgi:hypothetical protein
MAFICVIDHYQGLCNVTNNAFEKYSYVYFAGVHVVFPLLLGLRKLILELTIETYKNALY